MLFLVLQEIDFFLSLLDFVFPSSFVSGVECFDFGFLLIDYRSICDWFSVQKSIKNRSTIERKSIKNRSLGRLGSSWGDLQSNLSGLRPTNWTQVMRQSQKGPQPPKSQIFHWFFNGFGGSGVCWYGAGAILKRSWGGPEAVLERSWDDLGRSGGG